MAGSRPGRNIKYIYKANFSYGAWRQRYLEAVLRFVQAWNFRYIYMRIISKYVDMNDRPSVAGRKIIDRYLAGEFDDELTHLAIHEGTYRNKAETPLGQPRYYSVKERPPKPAKSRWYRKQERLDAEAKMREINAPQTFEGRRKVRHHHG